MKITIKAEDQRDPMDSRETLLRIEDGTDCDGGICGTAANHPDTGEIISTAISR
jgi:hypothetical protein